VTRLDLAYVLPMRWTDDAGLPELAGYLRWLATLVDVTVVDGSPPPLFARHAETFGDYVCHLPPDPDLNFGNGKVNGVTTGLRLARHEHVVIADDDVRYDTAALCAVHDLLHRHDLVRPQNHFRPLPWHARWDTARTLLNRALGADYPGTLAVRRSTFAAMGGYDGDVLFENLELIRTVRAAGGSEARPRDLYVRRLPPDVRRFWSQRVRQAYDDLAQPARLLTFLGVVPALLACAALGWTTPVVAAAAGTVTLAELGRRRAGGTAVFPAVASLLAPVWVLERGACVWAALALRMTRGGVRYGGRRLLVAAHGRTALARRLRGRLDGGVEGRVAFASARSPEPDLFVRTVAERTDG
jgi:hypothetical protein